LLVIDSTCVHGIPPLVSAFLENTRLFFSTIARLQERRATPPAQQGLNLMPLDQQVEGRSS
jgi:hypothetical protein